MGLILQDHSPVRGCDLGNLARRATPLLLANLDLSTRSYRLDVPAGWWSEMQEEWLGSG